MVEGMAVVAQNPGAQAWNPLSKVALKERALAISPAPRSCRVAALLVGQVGHESEFGRDVIRKFALMAGKLEPRIPVARGDLRRSLAHETPLTMDGFIWRGVRPARDHK